MKPLWLIISLLCIAVALVFLIRSDFDKALILAAIGAVAWFLNYRAQMKDLIARADEHRGLRASI